MRFPAPTEVIILHGEQDNKVPFEQGHRLAEIGHVPSFVIQNSKTSEVDFFS